MTDTPTAPAPQRTREAVFVAAIAAKCRDNGTRAELRRGLRRTPAQAVRLARHVVPTPGAQLDTRRREQVTYAIAAYTAAFTGDRLQAAGPLGEALARLQRTGRVSAASLDTRLETYARASLEAMLYQHLPATLTQLRSHGLTVDMATLMRDLNSWGTYRPQIVKRWMTAYYRPASPAAPAAGTAPANTPADPAAS